MRGRALQGWAEASRRILQGPTVRRPGIGPTVSFRVTTSPGVNPLPAPHRSSVNQPTDPRCPSSKFQGPHFHPNCCRHPDARPDCRSLSCALPPLRRPLSSCPRPGPWVSWQGTPPLCHLTPCQFGSPHQAASRPLPRPAGRAASPPSPHPALRVPGLPFGSFAYHSFIPLLDDW